jgi:hypothetical protein
MKIQGRKFVIMSVLLTLAIITCCSSPTIIKWSVLKLKKQQLIDKSLYYAYPGSVMENADASVSSFPVGYVIGIGVSVTFNTSDSFDKVKNWYVQHPDGGMCSIDGGNFPQCGLKLLDAKGGRTAYQVFNGLQMGCEEILYCGEINEQIP